MSSRIRLFLFFFFFNDTATTEIYTLSLHDALPICLDFNAAKGLVAVSHLAPHVPEAAYAMFQLAFAVITAALLVGAWVERMRFGAMLIFVGLWSLLVYAPVAHWVWEPGEIGRASCR